MCLLEPKRERRHKQLTALDGIMSRRNWKNCLSTTFNDGTSKHCLRTGGGPNLLDHRTCAEYTTDATGLDNPMGSVQMPPIQPAET